MKGVSDSCFSLVLHFCFTKIKEKGMKHWTHTPVCLTLESTVQSGISQAHRRLHSLVAPLSHGASRVGKPAETGSGPARPEVRGRERAGEDRHVLQLGRDGG